MTTSGVFQIIQNVSTGWGMPARTGWGAPPGPDCTGPDTPAAVGCALSGGGPSEAAWASPAGVSLAAGPVRWSFFPDADTAGQAPRLTPIAPDQLTRTTRAISF